MKICGIDIAAKQDLCAATTLEDRRITAIQTLAPPISYQTVLHYVEAKAGTHDAVIMDATGVGAVVYDILSPNLPALYGVRFTGGEQVNLQGRMWTAGKVALVQLLRKGLSGGVSLECDDEARRQLRTEMAGFRIVPGKRPGSLKYEAAPGATDDVLMSVALALLGLSLARNAGGEGAAAHCE